MPPTLVFVRCLEILEPVGPFASVQTGQWTISALENDANMQGHFLILKRVNGPFYLQQMRLGVAELAAYDARLWVGHTFYLYESCPEWSKMIQSCPKWLNVRPFVSAKTGQWTILALANDEHMQGHFLMLKRANGLFQLQQMRLVVAEVAAYDARLRVGFGSFSHRGCKKCVKSV